MNEQDKVEVSEEEKKSLLLQVHGDIFQQLLSFDKFNAFLASTYKIEYVQNDDEKTAGFKVTEYSPEESTKLLMDAMKAAKNQNDIILAKPEDLKAIDKDKRWGKRRVR